MHSMQLTVFKAHWRHRNVHGQSKFWQVFANIRRHVYHIYTDHVEDHDLPTLIELNPFTHGSFGITSEFLSSI